LHTHTQDVKDEKLDLTNDNGAGKLSFSGKRAASAGSPEQGKGD
jgi:hypothetical protein